MFERKRELTKREQEIVCLVSEGYRNKEVAKKLGISVKTVETHRANIMNKLHLKNFAALMHYAIKKGLIHIEKEVPKNGDRYYAMAPMLFHEMLLENGFVSLLMQPVIFG